MTRALFVLMIVLSASASLAQPKPGGAGAAGSGSGSSGGGQGSSSQASPQQGFVYFLKPNWHLQYASVRTESYSFTYGDLHDDNQRDTIFQKPITRDKRYTVLIQLDRWPFDTPASEKIDFSEYTIRPFQIQEAPVNPATLAGVDDNADTVLTVKVQYFDSIPRYWAARRFNWFSNVRLRVAITQDSGYLVNRVYYNDFNSKADRNLAFVTNPNYTGIRPVVASQVPFVRDHNEKHIRDERRLAEIESTILVPALDSFSKASSDSLRIVWYDRLRSIYKETLEPAYADHQDDLADAVKNGTKGKALKEQKKALSDEFGVLYRDHDLVVGAYNHLLEKGKTELTKFHDELLDPATPKDEIPGGQLAFLDNLFFYYREQVPGPDGVAVLFPGPIAVRPADDLVPETAIPIDGQDSATDVYGRIIHKSLMRQSIYYESFHYGTWDYGTLTVPYRYRFAPKNKYVFTSPGKDSIAAATSASDASINLSLYLGRKWGHTRFYEDPSMSHNTLSGELAFITGPTLVTLSAANIDTTSGYTGKRTDYSYTGPANIVAWSFGVGGELQLRTINFGIFTGLDVPLSANTGWIYARRFWLGFGIGVNLGMLTSGHSVN